HADLLRLEPLPCGNINAGSLKRCPVDQPDPLAAGLQGDDGTPAVGEGGDFALVEDAVEHDQVLLRALAMAAFKSGHKSPNTATASLPASGASSSSNSGRRRESVSHSSNNSAMTPCSSASVVMPSQALMQVTMRRALASTRGRPLPFRRRSAMS